MAARSNHLYSSVRSTSNHYGDSGAAWRLTTSSFSTHSHTFQRSSDRGKCSSFRQCFVSCYNARLVTVEPVVFLFMFAYSFYKVIFELYTFKRYGTEKIREATNLTLNTCLTTKELNNFPNTTITGNLIEMEVATLTLIVGVTARLPSVVTSLILGPLSDRFGRKPTMGVILFGMLLHAVVTIVVIEQQLDMHYFILGGILRGMGGGIAGMLTASYSYIADISSRKWLVFRLGILEAMTYVAGALSLIAGGVWSHLNNCDFAPLTWVMLGCMLVAIPYTLLVLPESVDKEGISISEREKKKKPKPLVGPKALFRGFQIFFGRGYPRCKLWILLVVMVLTLINTTGTVAIMTLFLLREPLQWNTLNIGIYLATSELIHGIALVLLLPILVLAGIHDDMIALIGILLSLSADVCLGFVDTTWQVYTIGTILGIEALILPAVKAIMSKAVRPADHGALFSFVSVAQVLATVIGYAMYIPVYTATLSLDWRHAGGISFFVMAVLYACMIPLMMIIMYLQKYKSSSPGNTPQSTPQHRPPLRTVNSSINGPPLIVNDSDDLYQRVNSELGQDVVERRSLVGSLAASLDLEKSFQSSSGSYRSFH